MRMRVTESQAPLFVKTGVRIWNARSVPVGSKFAKLAVPVNAPDTTTDRRRRRLPLIPCAAAAADDDPSASDCLLLDRRCVTDIDHLVSFND